MLIIFQNLENIHGRKKSRTLKHKLEKRGNNDSKIKDFLLEKRYENQFY